MIRDYIVSQASEKNIELKEIANQSGVYPSAITNFLKGKTEIHFYTVFKIVNYLFPGNEKEMMREYCLESKKPENVRLALEYASFYNLTDTLGELIERHRDSKNAKTREWVKVYELDYMLKISKITPQELITLTKSTKVNTPEMRVMCEWLEAYGYYLNEQYTFLIYTMENLIPIIDQIENEFIKRCYENRTSLALGSIALVHDKVELARECFEKVIETNLDKMKTAKAYYKLGESYAFDDFEVTVQYLKTARQMFIELEDKEMVQYAHRALAFTCNYWSKPFEFALEPCDPSDIQELAHREIRQGNLKQATEILSTIDEKDLRLKDMAYQYYYQGMIQKDPEYFYQSLILWNKCGNRFWAKLPYYEIEKLDLDPMLLETIRSLVFGKCK